MNDICAKGNGMIAAENFMDRDVMLAALQEAQDGRYETAFRRVFDYLMEARESLSWDHWKALCGEFQRHELHALFCQCPLHARAFEKPRGYAGDPVVIDYLYGLQQLPKDLPAEVEQFYRSEFRMPAARATRARKTIMAQAIDSVAREIAQPHILSMAAGHLREAREAQSIREGRIGRFVAFDQDQEALNLIRESKLGRMETVRNSVNAPGAADARLAGFDLIYSAGLYESLSDSRAAHLNESLFGMLRPGGKLLIANFAPNLPDKAFMEASLDWWMIYRNEEALEKLARGIRQQNSRRYFRDPEGCIAFQEITKRV